MVPTPGSPSSPLTTKQEGRRLRASNTEAALLSSNLGLFYKLVNIPDYARHVSAAELPSQAVILLGSFRSCWGLGLILFGLHLVVTEW